MYLIILSISFNDLEIYATSLHLLSLHLIDSTPPVAKLEVLASILNSLSKSGATSQGLLVKTCLSCLNVVCWFVPQFYLFSFLVKLFKGQAIFEKSFTNRL